MRSNKHTHVEVTQGTEPKKVGPKPKRPKSQGTEVKMTKLSSYSLAVPVIH